MAKKKEEKAEKAPETAKKADDAPAPEVEAEPFDPEAEPGPTVDAKGEDGGPGGSGGTLWPVLCHLSPLLQWILPVPGIGVIAPLIVWQTQKEDPVVDDQGREAVNFQINVLGVSLVLAITCVGVVLLPVLWAVSVVLSLIAGLQASEGKRYRYPFIYRVLQQ